MTPTPQTAAPVRTFRPAVRAASPARLHQPSADTAFLRDLRAISVDRIVTPNQIVISEKADDQMVGFVLSGVLRTVKTFADGTEKAVNFIYPGGFFGRLFTPSGFTVEAARLSRLRCANRAEFERLLAAHPDIQQRFFEKALSDLDLTRTWFLDLQRKTVLERLATYVRMLSSTDRRGANGAAMLKLLISRQDIALYLGTTRESVCRAFRQLADQQVLRLAAPRSIEILDDEALDRIAGEPIAELSLERLTDADFFSAAHINRVS
jgi:CRP-like cAMP-binding protein